MIKHCLATQVMHCRSSETDHLMRRRREQPWVIDDADHGAIVPGIFLYFRFASFMSGVWCICTRVTIKSVECHKAVSVDGPGVILAQTGHYIKMDQPHKCTCGCFCIRTFARDFLRL